MLERPLSHYWTSPLKLLHNVYCRSMRSVGFNKAYRIQLKVLMTVWVVFLQTKQWLCSHGLESRSERRFGSRSKTWLGSWFELHVRAFTCIVNAFPITIRICALRGNILLLLHSPRALIDPCAYAWLQRAFLKCTRTNHVPIELCVHMS